MKGKCKARREHPGLGAVGRLAKLINGAIFIGLTGVSTVALAKPGEAVWQLAVLILSACGLGLSLRVGFHVGPEGIRFRSYFRTFAFAFGGADRFECVLYRGFWNRYSPGNNVLNFGCHMLQVRKSSGRVIRLPATMGGHRELREAATLLNALTLSEPDSPVRSS